MLPKAKLFWTILLTREISKQPGNHYYASLTINRSITGKEIENVELEERKSMRKFNDGSISFRASPYAANLTTCKKKILKELSVPIKLLHRKAYSN